MAAASVEARQLLRRVLRERRQDGFFGGRRRRRRPFPSDSPPSIRLRKHARNFRRVALVGTEEGQGTVGHCQVITSVAPSVELGAVFGSTPKSSAPAPCTAELAMSSAVQCSTLPAEVAPQPKRPLSIEFQVENRFRMVF